QASPGRAALRAAGAAVPLLVAGGMARRHAARPAQRLHAARAGAAAAGLHGRRRALAHAAVSKDALIASLRGQCGGPRDGALLRYALGNACLAADDRTAAAEAWRQGIAVAQARGDKQAEKEMAVFLRRVERDLGD